MTSKEFHHLPYGTQLDLKDEDGDITRVEVSTSTHKDSGWVEIYDVNGMRYYLQADQIQRVDN
jgi:hypothetical protein